LSPFAVIKTEINRLKYY